MIEFLVVISERNERGFLVSGRCCAGPIQLDDCFNEASRICPEMDGLKVKSERLERLGEVDLRVAQIEAYGTLLTTLHEGYTCSMLLIGNDNGLLSAKVTLCGATN
jgi:hypothetical protein